MSRTSRAEQALRHTLLGVALLVSHSQASPAQTASAPSPSSSLPATVSGWPAADNDNMLFEHFLFNELEGRSSSSGDLFRWDAEGWLGTDMNRLWVKTEGFSTAHSMSDGDQEALYDRPIPHTRYFDGQAGVRVDADSLPTRVWAALGVQGLAPYRFDVEPTFYISDGGHFAGRMEGSYDLYITQRLVLQPQTELNFYTKDDPARRVGSGFSDLDGGLRLRYGFSRRFAPYIGWTYNGTYGDSARYERLAGEATRTSSFVFGIRLWY